MGRIDVAAGGGLRIANAALVARTTGAHHFHGSMRRVLIPVSDQEQRNVLTSSQEELTVDPADVRAIIHELRTTP
jgi:copper homeostasis protein